MSVNLHYDFCGEEIEVQAC